MSGSMLEALEQSLFIDAVNLIADWRGPESDITRHVMRLVSEGSPVVGLHRDVKLHRNDIYPREGCYVSLPLLAVQHGLADLACALVERLKAGRAFTGTSGLRSGDLDELGCTPIGLMAASIKAHQPRCLERAIKCFGIPPRRFFGGNLLHVALTFGDYYNRKSVLPKIIETLLNAGVNPTEKVDSAYMDLGEYDSICAHDMMIQGCKIKDFNKPHVAHIETILNNSIEKLAPAPGYIVHFLEEIALDRVTVVGFGKSITDAWKMCRTICPADEWHRVSLTTSAASQALTEALFQIDQRKIHWPGIHMTLTPVFEGGQARPSHLGKFGLPH